LTRDEYLAARSAKLGGTSEALAQAEAEWDEAMAAVARVDSEIQAATPRHYGRNGKIIQFRGEMRTIAGWARHLGSRRDTLWARIRRWGVERALTTPTRRYIKDDWSTSRH
jgi:hypothetical protein